MLNGCNSEYVSPDEVARLQSVDVINYFENEDIGLKKYVLQGDRKYS